MHVSYSVDFCRPVIVIGSLEDKIAKLATGTVTIV